MHNGDHRSHPIFPCNFAFLAVAFVGVGVAAAAATGVVLIWQNVLFLCSLPDVLSLRYRFHESDNVHFHRSIQSGNRAYGEITCDAAEPLDQGAYSCEAINIKGSCFAGSAGCGQPGQVSVYSGQTLWQHIQTPVCGKGEGHERFAIIREFPVVDSWQNFNKILNLRLDSFILTSNIRRGTVSFLNTFLNTVGFLFLSCEEDAARGGAFFTPTELLPFPFLGRPPGDPRRRVRWRLPGGVLQRGGGQPGRVPQLLLLRGHQAVRQLG